MKGTVRCEQDEEEGKWEKSRRKAGETEEDARRKRVNGKVSSEERM